MSRKKKGGRVTPKGVAALCRKRSGYASRQLPHLFTTRVSDARGKRTICSWCGKVK